MQKHSSYIDFYRIQILQIRRGISKAGIINAKPIMLLALLSMVENGHTENKFHFEECAEMYKLLFSAFFPSKTVAPFYQPFYYFESDGFWHLKWKDKKTNDRPSAKLVREQIEYGYFDEEFWTIIQNKDVIALYKEIIVEKYLK